MTETFQDRGLEFRLFTGRIRDAQDYLGPADCSLCKGHGHAFRVGPHCDIVTMCRDCGQVGAVPGSTKTAPCLRCGSTLLAPKLPSSAEATACYSCVRDRRVFFPRDTEYGFVGYREAVLGAAPILPDRLCKPSRVLVAPSSGPAGVHPTTPPGIVQDITDVEVPPARRRDSSAAEPASDHPGSVQLPSDDLFELLATPRYSTWQSESWQFDDRAPMIFRGCWGRRDFERHALAVGGTTGEKLCDETVGEAVYQWVGEDSDTGGVTVYVFSSSDGKRLRAHFDSD